MKRKKIEQEKMMKRIEDENSQIKSKYEEEMNEMKRKRKEQEIYIKNIENELKDIKSKQEQEQQEQKANNNEKYQRRPASYKIHRSSSRWQTRIDLLA